MNTYTWRGEPILDIEQWALDRGELMVDVIFKIREINPYAKNPRNMITYRKEKRTMPESFWHGLRMLDREIPSKVTFRKPIPHLKPDDRVGYDPYSVLPPTSWPTDRLKRKKKEIKDFFSNLKEKQPVK